MAEPNQQGSARFTYGDYVHWPEDERWELIDGVAYDMTPAPSRRHQELLGEIFGQLREQLRDHRCRVYLAPFDVKLPDSQEPDEQVHSVVQPDIAVVCDPAKLDDSGCRGAPDFIVEILSPSSSYHDEIRKRALYEKHGVREYWILDPVRRTATIYRLGTDGRYSEAAVPDTNRPCPVEAVRGITLDLVAAFGAVE